MGEKEEDRKIIGWATENGPSSVNLLFVAFLFFSKSLAQFPKEVFSREAAARILLCSVIPAATFNIVAQFSPLLFILDAKKPAQEKKLQSLPSAFVRNFFQRRKKREQNARAGPRGVFWHLLSVFPLERLLL